MNFADRLAKAIKDKGSPICVGLDPHFELLPEEFKKQKPFEAIWNFNRAILDVISPLVPIVKPQLAFYERWGVDGIRAFEATIKYAKELRLLVLVDGKRNDIGSTAQAYAEAYLSSKAGGFGAYIDALTVNAYLGSDGIKPFLEICKKEDKGIFVLVKTSNPSSGELQDLEMKNGGTVKEQLARNLALWGNDLVGKSGYSSLGAVVGATYPEDLQNLRKLMPKQFILIPGFGAQGATAKDLQACFDQEGGGAIVNSSRGITFAYREKEYAGMNFAEAAQRAVEKMREELEKTRS